MRLTSIGKMLTLTTSVSGSTSSSDNTLQLVTVILTSIYVAATLAIVGLTIWQSKAALAASARQSQAAIDAVHDQIKASEKQSQATIDAVNKQIATSEAQFQQERFTLHLPLLIPEGAPKFQRVKTNEQRISIHNVGAGVALNVASVLFGESYNTVSDYAIKYIHWTCWLRVPVAAGLVMKADHKLNRGLNDDVNYMRIGSYTLNAPEPNPNFSLPNTLARITITYLDIFRRKHASIFDYVETDGWQLVEFLEDITDDLHDLQFEASNR
jgi:hypothetical protein